MFQLPPMSGSRSRHSNGTPRSRKFLATVNPDEPAPITQNLPLAELESTARTCDTQEAETDGIELSCLGKRRPAQVVHASEEIIGVHLARYFGRLTHRLRDEPSG